MSLGLDSPQNDGREAHLLSTPLFPMLCVYRMEKFDPYYQPFTSDSPGRFAFIRQPTAMGVNVLVLGETAFKPLLKHVCSKLNLNALQEEKYLAAVKSVAEQEYGEFFMREYEDVRRRKLGLNSWEAGLGDEDLWQSALQLMFKYVTSSLSGRPSTLTSSHGVISYVPVWGRITPSFSVN